MQKQSNLSLPGRDLIKSPQDLRIWLLKLRSLIACEVLRQCFDQNNEFASDVAVWDVPVDGPWLDFIEWHFKASTGVKYRFSVETYHGAGGYWELV